MAASTTITQGRRIPDGEWFEWHERGDLRPGDYGRVITSRGDPRSAARWFNITPDGEMGVLRHDHGDGSAFHQVIEHENGTITVCPSIQGKVIASESVSGGGPISANGWHGWLERGVWRSA